MPVLVLKGILYVREKRTLDLEKLLKMFYCFKVLNYIKCRENSDNVENLDAVINDHIGFGNALLNRTQSMFLGADGTDPRGGTCLQWCRAGLGTAGGCLSNYSTLKSL